MQWTLGEEVEEVARLERRGGGRSRGEIERKREIEIEMGWDSERRVVRGGRSKRDEKKTEEGVAPRGRIERLNWGTPGGNFAALQGVT